MIGERNRPNPTVNIPPWTFKDDPTDDFFCLTPNFDSVTAVQRYLHSNTQDIDLDYNDAVLVNDDVELPVDAYACDDFRIFQFKVRNCQRGRSHDWTECPYAHPGEKARRRDPRKYHYSGTACTDFRNGNCKKGDACEFAHGVFESWLHPARYRTQPCKDRVNCSRKVCFFAHSQDQLRVVIPRTESHDGSSLESVSPRTLMGANSLSRSLGSNSVNEMVASLHRLQLNKIKSMPSSRVVQMGGSRVGLNSLPANKPGFFSLPSTPTRLGAGWFKHLDEGCGCEEEAVMERVESGRDVRVKMFEKLSKENPLDRVDPNPFDVSIGDIGWVAELVK